MKNKKKRGGLISGIKIIKKGKQKGGLSALNTQNKKNVSRTPKIYIGLSKNYLRSQNEAVEKTLEKINQIIIENNNDYSKSFSKLSDYILSRQCLSRKEIKNDEITISGWLQGPPSYDLHYADYNIDEEEKTSLTLVTLYLKKDNEKIKYSLHHNGIVISIHAIARLIQRMGHKSNHIEIKNEIDQIIPWGAIKSSLSANGLPYMKQLVSPSNHGAWFGSLCIINDKMKNEYCSVYFVRTFVSDSLMTENQLERLNIMRSDGVLSDELEEETLIYLQSKVSPSEEVVIEGLIRIFDSQSDFYSEDKFIGRVEDYLESLDIDFERISKGIDLINYTGYFERYRLVERANV